MAGTARTATVSLNALGTGRSPSRRGASTRRAVPVLLLALALPACATKKDVRLIRSEIQAMQLRQDSLLLLLQQQNRTMMDTMRAQGDLLMRVRGDLGHQIVELGQQLVQVQELAGQSQTRLTEIRQELDRRNRELGPEDPLSAGGALPAGAAAPEAREIYETAVGLIRSSPSTARRAFQQLVTQYPQDSLAADAQYQIAETYVVEQKFSEATREFELVVERWPASARAPIALFRAGVIAEQRGTIDKARGYFDRLVKSYPKSDEARQAQEKLRKLRR